MAGKKSSSKKKKVPKKIAGKETASQILRRFLRTYENNCTATKSSVCTNLRKSLREYIEEDKLLVKFIVEQNAQTESEEPLVSLEPLISTLKTERFTFAKYLHVWSVAQSLESIANLALLLEKKLYPFLLIELMNCLIGPEQISRLSQSFNMVSNLTTVNLDYNEFGDDGCKGLCDGLTNNATVLSLSLCYCDLGANSGSYLGVLLANTAIRELYLDGNSLEAKGLTSLISPLVKFAEHESRLREDKIMQEKELQRMEAQRIKEEKENRFKFNQSPTGTLQSHSEKEISEGENKPENKSKKKTKKRRKKAPPLPPTVEPSVQKLHLADNAFDVNETDGLEQLIYTMRLFQRLIINSKHLEELDLYDNLIGNMVGRGLVTALEERKEAKLPDIKIRTTHRMEAETFGLLLKYGSGMKKKKKRKKKKSEKKTV